MISIRLILLCSLPVTMLSAQTQPNGPGGQYDPIPTVSSTGVADVKVTPDRATIQISVQTRGVTAAATASENTKKQTAVLAALQRLGFPNERLSTSNYTVEPQYRYVQNKEPLLVGYVVTNTIVADVHDVRQIGPAIDASLGAGANMISSLDFYSSNTSTAKRQAIMEGVEKARGEAEAAAKAAGGSLGNVIDIQIDADFAQPPRPMYSRALAASGDSGPTPINPGQQTLTVRVFTRWKLIGGDKRP